MPSGLSALLRVALQEPAEQLVVPDWLEPPLTDQLTVLESPLAVPQVPPIELTFWFVEKGKLTVLPFTFVSVTAGAVLSSVYTCPVKLPLPVPPEPAVPVPVPPSLFPAASVIESLSFRFSPSVPLPEPVEAVTV